MQQSWSSQEEGFCEVEGEEGGAEGGRGGGKGQDRKDSAAGASAGNRIFYKLRLFIEVGIIAHNHVNWRLSVGFIIKSFNQNHGALEHNNKALYYTKRK